MKIKIQILGLAALLPAAILTCISCSTEPKDEGNGLTPIRRGEPGGVRVETYKETASVAAIDKATRKVTLVETNGNLTIVKCGPEVANFDQIEVGDQVKASVTRQLVVSVRKPGELAGNGAATMVALAPIGDKPGGVVANVVEITAKVISIDAKHQNATLLFPDGTVRTFQVRKDVDLKKQTVGEDVVIRTTEAIAISVEKP